MARQRWGKLFHHGHCLAEIGGLPRGFFPAGPATDDNEIEFLFVHAFLLYMWRSRKNVGQPNR